jgi:hypothetical protein
LLDDGGTRSMSRIGIAPGADDFETAIVATQQRKDRRPKSLAPHGQRRLPPRRAQKKPENP